MPSNLSELPDYFKHEETMRLGKPIWPDGRPVPWMTYPAICYLEQLDFSQKRVFEYGCGSSTAYWAKRALRTISV